MYHTDIKPIIDAVRNIEKADLVRALEAHGGSYTFNPETNPVGVVFQGIGAESALILRARIKEKPDGKDVELIVEDAVDDYTVETSLVYAGQLSGITAAIPEPTEKS
jgi:hypothetical protein